MIYSTKPKTQLSEEAKKTQDQYTAEKIKKFKKLKKVLLSNNCFYIMFAETDFSYWHDKHTLMNLFNINSSSPTRDPENDGFYYLSVVNEDVIDEKQDVRVVFVVVQREKMDNRKYPDGLELLRIKVEPIADNNNLSQYPLYLAKELLNEPIYRCNKR